MLTFAESQTTNQQPQFSKRRKHPDLLKFRKLAEDSLPHRGFSFFLELVFKTPDYSPFAQSWEKGKAHKADYSEPQSNFEKHEEKAKSRGNLLKQTKQNQNKTFENAEIWTLVSL